MLNSESRKYFTRAYLNSGSASPWKVQDFNHTQRLQKCLEVNATGSALVEYMKAVNFTTLAKCSNLTWIVFYESPDATDAFITKTPHEIYNSDNPPVMDTMSSITSQVRIRKKNLLHFSALYLQLLYSYSFRKRYKCIHT